MASPLPLRPVAVLGPHQPYGEVLLRSELAAAGAAFEPGRAAHTVARFPPAQGEAPSEEELLVYGRAVYWTSGRALRHRLTADGDVLQAAWARFQARLCALRPAAPAASILISRSLPSLTLAATSPSRPASPSLPTAPPRIAADDRARTRRRRRRCACSRRAC